MIRRLRRFGGRLGSNAARVMRLVGARSALGRSDREIAKPVVWLLARVGPQVSEQRLSFSLGRERGLALVDLLCALEAAGRDARIAGVIVRIEGAPLAWSQAAALRRALAALREAGRRVWAWSESLDAVHYYAVSSADRILLPPTGSLHLVGLRSQQFFVRDAFQRLDIRPEVVRIGSHKAAGETFTRTAMSPEQREQLGAWQDDLFDELLEGIAQGRGIDPEAVRHCIDQGPYAAGAAVEAGLIDECRYPDELENELSGRGAAEPDEPPLVDIAAYSGLHASDPGWRPLVGDLPRLAYVVVRGQIQRGRSHRGVASSTFAELFARLRRDDDVRGVVLRVDCPGGDAVASDLLHRAVERLAAEKPVVVSMSQVAASGGYYLSAGAQSILAETATLTGSIGVVGGKVDLSGLYRKLGVSTDSVESGERAGMASETRGFTPGERAALQREMRALYATFVDRVAHGRSLGQEQVERVAQGRIFSGKRAHGHGLVDAIGGPLEALAEVRRLASLGDAERLILDVYPRRPALADLRALLSARLWMRARVRLD